MKGSTDSDDSLDSKKKRERKKRAGWVGAQNQVTSAKKVRKHASIVTSPQETSNPIQFFLNLN